MPDSGFSTFVEHLHNDHAFRQRFAKDPAGVLREFGLDPDLLDLPAEINLRQLEERIAEGHRGNARWTLPDAAQSERLTADELWERFHFIRLRPEANFTVIGSVSGVIYGTTATTSTTITVQGGGAGLQSFEQITRLRALSRLPKGQLRFAVTSADGLAVADIRIDTLRALLGQVKPG